jgi:hypothetical protein
MMPRSIKKLMRVGITSPSMQGQLSLPAPQQSPLLVATLEERQQIYEQIDWSVRNGMVADALPLALYSSHLAERGEYQRQLEDETASLYAALRQLDAMFPEPEPIAPEPPAPRAPRLFPRLGSLLGQRREPPPSALN